MSDALSIFQQPHATPMSSADAQELADLRREREAAHMTRHAALDASIADLTARLDDIENEQAAIVDSLEGLSATITALTTKKPASGTPSAPAKGKDDEGGPDKGAKPEPAPVKSGGLFGGKRVIGR
jgi:hypothetical protein